MIIIITIDINDGELQNEEIKKVLNLLLLLLLLSFEIWKQKTLWLLLEPCPPRSYLNRKMETVRRLTHDLWENCGGRAPIHRTINRGKSIDCVKAHFSSPYSSSLALLPWPPKFSQKSHTSEPGYWRCFLLTLSFCFSNSWRKLKPIRFTYRNSMTMKPEKKNGNSPNSRKEFTNF